MDKIESMFALLCFGLVVVIIVCCFGYVANVVNFCKCDFAEPYKAEIIRGLGIAIPPVGVVAGFCNIADGPPESTGP